MYDPLTTMTSLMLLDRWLALFIMLAPLISKAAEEVDDYYRYDSTETKETRTTTTDWAEEDFLTRQRGRREFVASPRTLSAEELKDVKDALRQILPGHDLDNIITTSLIETDTTAVLATDLLDEVLKNIEKDKSMPKKQVSLDETNDIGTKSSNTTKTTSVVSNSDQYYNNTGNVDVRLMKRAPFLITTDSGLNSAEYTPTNDITSNVKTVQNEVSQTPSEEITKETSKMQTQRSRTNEKITTEANDYEVYETITTKSIVKNLRSLTKDEDATTIAALLTSVSPALNTETNTITRSKKKLSKPKRTKNPKRERKKSSVSTDDAKKYGKMIHESMPIVYEDPEAEDKVVEHIKLTNFLDTTQVVATNSLNVLDLIDADQFPNDVHLTLPYPLYEQETERVRPTKKEKSLRLDEDSLEKKNPEAETTSVEKKANKITTKSTEKAKELITKINYPPTRSSTEHNDVIDLIFNALQTDYEISNKETTLRDYIETMPNLDKINFEELLAKFGNDSVLRDPNFFKDPEKRRQFGWLKNLYNNVHKWWNPKITTKRTTTTTQTSTTTTKARPTRRSKIHGRKQPKLIRLFLKGERIITTMRRRKTLKKRITESGYTGPTYFHLRNHQLRRFIDVVQNLSQEYAEDVMNKLNRTIQELGMRRSAEVDIIPNLSISTENVTLDYNETTTTTKSPYANLTGTIMGKCFVCGLDEETIPYKTHCSDAFATEFLPLVKVDATARSQVANFRKYCRWENIPRYVEKKHDPRSMWGRWTGGCAVRWVDVSPIYTQRTCRNRHRAIMGKHFASKRMAKLEMALQHTDNGCIISPVASLLPLSRAISLYARFSACVCTGSWCNATTKCLPSIFTIALLAFLSLVIS